MFVLLEPVDREQLVVEASRRGRCGPAALGAEPERVLVFTRNIPPLCDVLAGLAHRLEREHPLQARIRKAPAERRVPHRLIAAWERTLWFRHDKRRTRHRFDAARDEQIAVARSDRVTCGDDRGEAGCAEAVHRHAGDGLGETREQRSHSRNVAVVLARLVGGAEPDILDRVGGNAGACDGFGDHGGRHVVGTNVCECTAVAPDRRTHAREDDCATHCVSVDGRLPAQSTNSRRTSLYAPAASARRSSSSTARRPSSPYPCVSSLT